MSYGSDISNSSGWWRWALLPFASFLGAMAGTFLIGLFQWFGMKMQGGFSTDGWYFMYVMPVISSAVFGWLYVLITLNVAPKGKFITAVVMVTVLVVLGIIGQIFSWANPSNTIGYSTQGTIGTLTTIVSAIMSLVSYRDEYA